ncbi:MAG: co-chaperone YbbN [Hyphomicrobiales bacterium]|nr:co-chaperone YbbN [Hyphomicrobiales bacterium]
MEDRTAQTQDQNGGIFTEDSGDVGASGSEFIIDTTPQTFLQDVLEASMQLPVIVDFWGPSCAPCRQLTPILEKATIAANGAVRLVKMNIEAYPEIAEQLRISSIPAVMIFSKGQPVDGFVGAASESQVKEMFTRLLGELPASPAENNIELAEQALESGDTTTAAQYFSQVLQSDATNPRAIGGFARALIAVGDVEQAERILEKVKTEDLEHEAVVAAKSSLALAQKSANVGDLSTMESRVQQSPDDHAARFDLALALHGANRKSDAIEQLLEIVKRDPKWNEQAARKQLVELFEAYGNSDTVTIEGRKKLSSLLFS